MAVEKETPTALGQASSQSLMVRLSIMMFLQYFVQGAYLPIASVYVQDHLGFTAMQVGLFGSALAVGPILAPFIVGQLVDRLFATQWVMAGCHLLGGLLMITLSFQTEFWPVVMIGTVYSILYVPTMMLTNSLAFRHLRNGDMEFPWIRLFGTIGYIVPAYLIEFWWVRGLTGDQLASARAIAFVFSGTASILMAVYCLSLPHTPPQCSERRKYAPGAVLQLLWNRSFLTLMIVSFLIAIAHQFIIVWNSPFLRAVLNLLDVGGYEQSLSSLGQIAEIGVLAVLGWLIKGLGYKRTMILGAVAYLVRCLLFASVFMLDVGFAGKLALAVSGQALHGLCFGCFLAVGFMYVDRISPLDVRGSMQNIYGVCVLSLGFFFGGFVGGWVGEIFTTGTLADPIRNWPAIWCSCAAICAVAVFVLAVGFRDDDLLGRQKTIKS